MRACQVLLAGILITGAILSPSPTRRSDFPESLCNVEDSIHGRNVSLMRATQIKYLKMIIAV